MTYGLSTRAFIEDGPVEQVANAEARRSTARSWRALMKPVASSWSRRLSARQRSHRHLPACSLSERKPERERNVKMVDEIFDRHYQAGRTN